MEDGIDVLLRRGTSSSHFRFQPVRVVERLHAQLPEDTSSSSVHGTGRGSLSNGQPHNGGLLLGGFCRSSLVTRRGTWTFKVRTIDLLHREKTIDKTLVWLARRLWTCVSYESCLIFFSCRAKVLIEQLVSWAVTRIRLSKSDRKTRQSPRFSSRNCGWRVRVSFVESAKFTRYRKGKLHQNHCSKTLRFIQWCQKKAAFGKLLTRVLLALPPFSRPH